MVSGMGELPQVSLIWLNYNGMRIKDVMLASLNSLLTVDYPSVELIIVDNSSNDGSKELIDSVLNAQELRDGFIVKRLFLDKNYGFTKANNLAYAIRDPASKYVGLVNNDFVLAKDSLRRLVEYTEHHSDIGAVQGVHVNIDNKTINNAGSIFSNLLVSFPLFLNYPKDSLRFPIKVSYTCGCYSLYRISSLEFMGLRDKLFNERFFAYFDDYVLGLMLWNYGFKSVVIPFITGSHMGSATFSSIK